MKRLLLDTQALLWWLSDNASLGKKARITIEEPRNEVFVSAASSWEISIKKNIGKLMAPDDIDSIVEDEGFIKLPISLYHGEQAGQLPNIHKDPFDRMLIAQAQAEGLILVTSDGYISEYKVKVMNAKE